ncbi:hypothetical protein G6F37_011249 [Rhizopus arrhizus]|nr:hypothetical protein G6F38_009375 [Rhizopus arrhizus]KAG1150239.1 hypothetical protein G6F37_011249 [Rhizopus arrhizus]
MEDVMSTIDDPNIVLETLVNHSSYMKNKPLEKQPTENKKSTTSKPVKFASKRTNAAYSINRRTTTIDRMIELPMRQRSYEETGEAPIKKSTRNPGRPNNFTEEHKAYVLDLIDDDLQATVCDTVESLTKSFKEFSLTKSAIHKHMNETCNLSVKKPHFESEKRNSPENLRERYEWFMKWKDSDIDFTKNCIFIDESGFHINMRKNYAWSRKSERAVVKLPQTRAASHTIIGAISTKCIIHIALKKPLPPPAKNTKKRARDNKGKKRAVTAVEKEAGTTTSDYSQKPPRKETTSAHYTKVINELLDILDDMGDMKGSYLFIYSWL